MLLSSYINYFSKLCLLTFVDNCTGNSFPERSTVCADDYEMKRIGGVVKMDARLGKQLAESYR